MTKDKFFYAISPTRFIDGIVKENDGIPKWLGWILFARKFTADEIKKREECNYGYDLGDGKGDV